jgi:DNA-binding beta-propeller fold protein YncE
MTQMRYHARLRVITIAAIVVCATAFPWVAPLPAQGADPVLPLRLVVDVPTRPAGKSFVDQTPRMDYESIDPVRRMLYVAYMGADEVIAFNLDSNKIVAHISGLSNVHGALAIPELDRLYVSATGADQVAAIDERSLRVVARTAGGDYPDGIAYDPADHRIFVSDEHGGTDIVIDVRTNKTADTIDLGGEVGNTQFDPTSGLVYSDVQTRDDIVAIDPKTDKIVGRHALPGCDHDHGLLLDVPHRLAFVACDGNAKLLLLDLKNWKVLSTYDIGSDPDVLAFDPGLMRLYVAAESGVVTVLKEDGRSLKSLGKAFLADEAHTVAVDAKTHRVYFALQSVGGKPVIRVMAPTGI